MRKDDRLKGGKLMTKQMKVERNEWRHSRREMREEGQLMRSNDEL